MGRYRPERSSGSSCLKVLGVGCGGLVACLAVLCVAGMVFGLFMREEAKKDLAEADRLWDAGQKPEAVGRYRGLLLADRVPDHSREPLLYQRVVEYDLEHADTASARTLVDHAVERKVDVPSQNEAVAKLVAEAKAERERKAEEQRQAEVKRKEEERKNAPRLSVEIVKVRLEPFRTAQGQLTHMVCVDWKNTGNRPVRAVSVKMRGYDKDDREVEIMPVSDYYIYAVVANDRPGVAPGETYTVPAFPEGTGVVIAPTLDPRVVRVNVKIVKVEEKVPE